MTDGRVYTPEDELEVLEDDLRRARHRLESMERARFEGRVTDLAAHELHIAEQREWVAVLEGDVVKARQAFRDQENEAA